MSSRRLPAVLVVLAALLLAAAGPGIGRQSGPDTRARVAQLAGLAACVQNEVDFQDLEEDEPPECAGGKALVGPTGTAVSPDGKHVYAASSGSDAIVWLARDGGTGALTWTGCLSDDSGTGIAGTDGQCADGDAVDGPRSVAVSPDGANVYAAAAGANGVLSFARDGGTGALTQLGCVKDSVEEGRCADRYALGGARAVAVSPDGNNVYAVASGSDSIITLDRDPAGGRLTFAGCISDDGTNGLCTDGEAMRGAISAAVSPDGENVYVAASGSGAVLTFARDTGTGELTQTGCDLHNAPPGPCLKASALQGASSVALAGDGSTVFATATGSGALTAFRRDSGTGALTEVGCTGPDRSGPAESASPCSEQGVSEPEAVATGAASGELIVTGGSAVVSIAYDPASGAFTRTSCVAGFELEGCTEGRALTGPAGIAVTPDGRNAYVASPDDNAVLAFAEGAAVPARSGVVRRGVVRVPLACPRRAAGGCRGVLELRPASSRGGMAARRFRLRAGRSAAFGVRLPARSARALLRRRRLRATVTVREPSRALPPLRGVFVLESGKGTR